MISITPPAGAQSSSSIDRLRLGSQNGSIVILRHLHPSASPASSLGIPRIDKAAGDKDR
jgi:hypothetical protein